MGRKGKQMQPTGNTHDGHRERAKFAAEAAQAAESMGHRDIALAYRNIEKMWLKLAQQNEALDQ